MKFPALRLSFISLLLLISIAAGLQFVPVRETGFSHNQHTANVGELVGDVMIGQTLVAQQDKLSAISVMFATYSGRHNTKPIEFHLRRVSTAGPGLQLAAQDLRLVTVLPQELGDNQLHRFTFEPIVDSAGETFFFFVVSPESTTGDAVTIDVDKRDPYHLGSAFIVRDIKLIKLDSEVLAQSGKPTLDVVFETYYTVPLRVAASHKIVGMVRYFLLTWDEQQSAYLMWAKIVAPALIFIGWLIALGRGTGRLGSAAGVRWALLGLFVLAVIVRVVYALELPATNDEGNYLYDARTLLRGQLAGGDGYVKAPLVVLWVAAWQLLFGNSMLAGRLSSIVIGSLTVLPIYVLGRSLWDRRAGLMAAAAWALLGVTTVFSIYVHTQPLALFFGISGLAVLIMGLRGETISWVRAPGWLRRPGVQWFVLAGVLLGLGVVSRKSILALGLVPLVVIIVESRSWREGWSRLAAVAVGFIVVVGLVLAVIGGIYGGEGVWEAMGVNSAEDSMVQLDPAEREHVRAYSLRGMTPFFRESLPLILLSLLGWGVLIEWLLSLVVRPLRWVQRELLASYLLPKLGWIAPGILFWWTWGFWLEYEGSSVMVFGMRQLWYAMAAVLVLVALLPRVTEANQQVKQAASQAGLRWSVSRVLLPSLWVAGLVFFYMNWIKFHANYIGEFLPPLVLLAGVGMAVTWDRVRVLTRAVRRPILISLLGVILWAVFVSSYVTFVFEHTGTFQLAAAREAAVWARDNIPTETAIFTGAALIPYLSGHHVALDIAHPRWYAYEFTRTDTKRLNTFLPPADEMVRAFREATWVLHEKQTGFSFFTVYPEIEAGFERDFERAHGIRNGSNTLTFYRRVNEGE